jgi:hypothetical protein
MVRHLLEKLVEQESFLTEMLDLSPQPIGLWVNIMKKLILMIRVDP